MLYTLCSFRAAGETNNTETNQNWSQNPTPPWHNSTWFNPIRWRWFLIVFSLVPRPLLNQQEQTWPQRVQIMNRVIVSVGDMLTRLFCALRTIKVLKAKGCETVSNSCVVAPAGVSTDTAWLDLRTLQENNQQLPQLTLSVLRTDGRLLNAQEKTFWFHETGSTSTFSF